MRLIENTAHPAIIALIMRRSVGIQALECHVLITRVLNDSIRIVNEVRNVCARHKYDLNQRANLFQYRPAVVTSVAEQQQRAGQLQHLQQQQQANNKPPTYHKPSPFSRLQKRAVSRDESRTAGVYDAFSDNSFIANRTAPGVDSRSNVSMMQTGAQQATGIRNQPGSPSLFSKLKSNLIDKNKTAAHSTDRKNEPKPEKSKE